MINIEENFLELIDIEDIEDIGYRNTVDITVNNDKSFILSNGIISHNSALGSVRKYRDTQIVGAFPLKGKFLNVREISNSKIIKNEEAKNLMASIGLKLGEKADDLRYGKVYIYTDADPDGMGISAMLINFFAKFWPELFEEERIYHILTPIVVAKKNKITKVFYSNEEYLDWYEKETNIKQWNIEYKKGLASLEDKEYKDIINNPKTVKIELDENYNDTLNTWFSKDSNKRKVRILKNN